MKKDLTLYHGSPAVVDRPSLQAGKPNNDYGRGLYCTESFDLACEWAVKSNIADGYANRYTLKTAGLRILNLSAKEYNILHWITLLLENRTFTTTSIVAEEGRTYLRANYHLDTTGYDVIRGYRADDSYFSFAQDFLNNTISVQHLARAMRLGKLGIQYALISDNAFRALTFVEATPVERARYYPKYHIRDEKARQDYRNSKNSTSVLDGELFMIDLIRGRTYDADTGLS